MSIIAVDSPRRRSSRRTSTLTVLRIGRNRLGVIFAAMPTAKNASQSLSLSHHPRSALTPKATAALAMLHLKVLSAITALGWRVCSGLEINGSKSIPIKHPLKSALLVVMRWRTAEALRIKMAAASGLVTNLLCPVCQCHWRLIEIRRGTRCGMILCALPALGVATRQSFSLYCCTWILSFQSGIYCLPFSFYFVFPHLTIMFSYSSLTGTLFLLIINRMIIVFSMTKAVHLV